MSWTELASGFVDPETADRASHVPVDRSSERVLKVVPDDAARGAQQVA
jgi:hypothetical protein